MLVSKGGAMVGISIVDSGIGEGREADTTSGGRHAALWRTIYVLLEIDWKMRLAECSNNIQD